MYLKITLQELAEIIAALEIEEITNIKPHPDGLTLNLKSIPLKLAFSELSSGKIYMDITLNKTNKLLNLAANKFAKNIGKLIPKSLLPEGVKIKQGRLEIDPNKVLEYLTEINLGLEITSMKLKSEILEIKIKVSDDGQSVLHVCEFS